jgi:hypothetical protein
MFEMPSANEKQAIITLDFAKEKLERINVNKLKAA